MNKAEYLLTCLTEECAEIQQATTKALRFGLDKGRPTKEPFTTNAEDIIGEYCDLIAIMELLHEEGIINTDTIDPGQRILRKKGKVRYYMEHANLK
jgi:hypothetical protein